MRNDLVQIWGEENIWRLRQELATRLDLSERTKTVLVELGLPYRVDPLFETDLGHASNVPSRIHTTRHAGRWYRIGFDGATDIGVEAESDTVMSLSPSSEYRDRFVNSSLAAFVSFLYQVSRSRAAVVGQSDATADSEIAKLEETLMLIDPQALASEDNWWSVILDELKDGLL